LAAAASAEAQPAPAEVPESTAPAAESALSPRSDDAVAAEARKRLDAFDDLKGVTVRADAGVVRLGGEVLTLQAWRQAENLAGATDGVSAVINDIEISADVRGQVNALRQTVTRAANLAPLIAFAIVVLLLFLALSWLVGRWAAPFERISRNRFVQDVAQTTVRAILVLAGVVLALQIVDATAIAGALIGTAGVAGVALGFAFKDLIENFLASVLLSTRQPFAPNDLVNVDGFEGTVVRLTSRATVLMTPEGNHIRIPNARVYKGVILNYTRNPRRRFDFIIAVGSESDLSASQAVGVEELRQMSGVLDDPEPWSHIVEIGDSSVPIRFYGWIDQRSTNFSRARSEAIRLVKEGLEAAGFQLPEPTYRIRSDVPDGPQADRTAPTAASEHYTDIRERGDPIVDQINEERQVAEPTDLLDPSAPQE
jgi:small-conductance mechanosensitive channel